MRESTFFLTTTAAASSPPSRARFAAAARFASLTDPADPAAPPSALVADPVGFGFGADAAGFGSGALRRRTYLVRGRVRFGV